MAEFQLKGNRFGLSTKIGQGSTSQVYKATNQNGQSYCIKIIHNTFYNTPTGKELIDNEINILSKISHQNILTFYKAESKDMVMIVTELCEEGTLYDYLKKKKTIEEKQCSQIMRAIIEGCSYLHAKGILHRDLKPENIFIKNKKIKIADFGFAVQTGNHKLRALNVGSPLYMPFEALSDKKFSIESDIFAIGVIWYELLTGMTPFSAMTEHQLKEKTKNNQFRTKEIKCAKKISRIILRCISKTVSERPKMQQLLDIINQTNEIQRLKVQSFMETTNITKNTAFNGVKSKESKENKPLPTIYNKENRSITQGRKESKYKYQKYLPKVMELKKKQITKVDPLKIKIQQSLNMKTQKQSPQSFMTILGRLAQLNLGFLPQSIQVKFVVMIKKYQNILSEKGDKSNLLVQMSSQLKNDELISQITKCQSQSSFCRCFSDFLRRLMRIAKSYKEWSSCLKDLNLLWQRVQSICKINGLPS